MSAKDKNETHRRAAHSGVQELRPKARTFSARLLDLSRRAASVHDVADMLDLYFTFFEELDASALWAVHLFSEDDIMLTRASSRMPFESKLPVTQRAWLEAGLSLQSVHPSVELVDALPGAFEVVLTEGPTALGVLLCGTDAGADTRLQELELIAASISPRLAPTLRTPDFKPVGDYLSTLIRCADVPLLLLDGSNLVALASRAFRRILGRGEISMTPWAEFVAPRDWHRVAEATRNGSSVECDLIGVASTLRMQLEFISLSHPSLRGAGTLIIGRDLSTLRNLERQVIHAEKLATLGQLAAGVVHELNNPLTSILAYAQHIRDGSVQME